MTWSPAPGVVILLVTALVLYARAVHRLGTRGYAVPRPQQAAAYTGLLLTAIALASPLDDLGAELLGLHMAQHLLIADLAAPLLLAGIRWPVHVHLLPRAVLVPLARRKRLRKAFAAVRRPVAAVVIYVTLLYFWHLAPFMEAAVRNDFVHTLQHQSFVLGSVLVWWPALEPHRRRLRGALWKIGHVLAARIGGMFLGMALILTREPIYDVYVETAPRRGLSPVADQQLAGGLMLSLDFFVVMFALSFFFWHAARQEDIDRAAPHRAV
jgi:putative copper resistance protein D